MQRRAYVLADNKLALAAGWSSELLAIELQALIDRDFDVELTAPDRPTARREHRTNRSRCTKFSDR